MLNNLNSPTQKFRVRTGLKESTSGIVTRDLTVEFEDGTKIQIQNHSKDIADVTTKEIADVLWDLFEKMGQVGKDRNHKVAEFHPSQRSVKK